MIRQLISSLILIFVFSINHAQDADQPIDNSKPFIGTWSFDIDNGNVGWLHLHKDEGFLDGALMWEGGSATPIGYAYMADEHTLVVTRSYARDMSKSDGTKVKQYPTAVLRLKRVGDQLAGRLFGPHWNGDGEVNQTSIGTRMPEMPSAPDLSKVKYGEPIHLFNGKNLEGWRIIHADHANGFLVKDGTLANNPVQNKPGEYIHYGNLRTEQEFEDFNIKLEVNVPKGNNSGVYLRGLYEVQIYDSYGKDVDSHHMGAVYSRITPSVAAEKPPGTWQTLDITLCDRHATVILNGQKIIDNQPIAGPTGGAIISDVNSAGPIFLQGDHGNVSYRNIVLTPIIK